MDDSELFLEMTRTALRSAGYDVVCATDLAQLEEVRARGGPDLVLMDVQMPEAFGDDIAMILRDAHGVTVPIYLLSSLEETDLAERVRWARIDGFISKTIGITAIVERVRGILGAGR
jgi:two-component system OmpR family response regulator